MPKQNNMKNSTKITFSLFCVDSSTGHAFILSMAYILSEIQLEKKNNFFLFKQLSVGDGVSVRSRSLCPIYPFSSDTSLT